MADTEREAFQAWWSSRIPKSKDDDHAREFAYEVWCAALCSGGFDVPSNNWPRGSIGAQEFLRWNRSQSIPLVAIPMEMGVYRKAIEIHKATSNSLEIDGIAQSSGNTGELTGWKLVPIDLTEDMLIAFAEVWYSKKRCIDDCEMADCYAAMLEAAPDHVIDVGNMVSDTARMSFIEKNAVQGATYRSITSANVLVYEHEWHELGLRGAIDAAMSRIARAENKEK